MTKVLERLLTSIARLGGMEDFPDTMENILAILPQHFGQDVVECFAFNGRIWVRLTEYGLGYVRNGFSEV